MSEEPKVVVDAGYMSAEQLELHRQKWLEEQIPHPVETQNFQQKKFELEQEFGLPVCVFATSDQLTALAMLPDECRFLARKKFTGDQNYMGEIIIFSEENPDKVFLLDLSDEQFGVFSNIDEED